MALRTLALELGGLRRLERWVPDLAVQRLDCGHWTQQELPEEVNRRLFAFFGEGVSDSPRGTSGL